MLLSAGDVVVADEEGVVVTPPARQEQVLPDARAKAAGEAAESLDAWEAAHRARVDGILAGHGFAGRPDRSAQAQGTSCRGAPGRVRSCWRARCLRFQCGRWTETTTAARRVSAPRAIRVTVQVPTKV